MSNASFRRLPRRGFQQRRCDPTAPQCKRDQPTIETAYEILKRDSDARRRHAAVKALEQIGNDRAVALLLQVAEHDVDFHVRQAAVEALSGLNHDLVVSTLLRILERDSSWSVREAAAKALSSSNDVRVVEALGRTLRHEEVTLVRRAAVLSLRSLQNNQAVALLLEVAETDPDWQVRWPAAVALGYLAVKLNRLDLLRQASKNLPSFIEGVLQAARESWADRMKGRTMLLILRSMPELQQDHRLLEKIDQFFSEGQREPDLSF